MHRAPIRFALQSASILKITKMSVVQSQAPTIMSLTDSAAAKVQSLIAEEGNPQLKLRVFVTGGGCSGFQYGFSFDEEVADDDTLIENFG